MTNRLELNWKLGGFVDEQRYYCSETPFDVNNLPMPKAIITGGGRTYTDTAIEVGKTYYVAVSSVKGGIEKISSEKRITAKDLSNYFIDIDFNGADGSPIYENVSNTILTNSDVSIQNNQGVFTGGVKVDVPTLTLSGDFVISVDIFMTTTIADYMNLFNQGVLLLRFGNSGFGYKLQIGINGSTLGGVYSCALTQSNFVNAGVKNIKFSRINGVCTLKVDDVVQNLGTGANPTSYPYTSFTNTSTPELLNPRVGDGYVGKMDNFAILKS